MRFLGTLLTLGGYILIYAATANGGKYAKNPWMGVFRDAYGVDQTPPKSRAPAVPGPSGPLWSGPPGGPTGRPRGRNTNPNTGVA